MYTINEKVSRVGQVCRNKETTNDKTQACLQQKKNNYKDNKCEYRPPRLFPYFKYYFCLSY
jgi:hypothetical protein